MSDTKQQKVSKNLSNDPDALVSLSKKATEAFPKDLNHQRVLLFRGIYLPLEKILYTMRRRLRQQLYSNKENMHGMDLTDYIRNIYGVKLIQATDSKNEEEQYYATYDTITLPYPLTDLTLMRKILKELTIDQKKMLRKIIKDFRLRVKIHIIQITGV